MLGDQILERKTSSKEVGLIVKESFNLKEHLEFRISKALKCLFLFKRNTHQSLAITTKVHLYRAIINPTLLFGSECLELTKVVHKLIENFNAKALKWICGNINYIDSVFSMNVLPQLSYKILKDVLLYSNITTATMQLTLPSTMISNVKEDRQEYYCRLPSTKQNAKISATGLDLESK